AKELGVTVHGVARAPAGEALQLRPVRIAVYDVYGGNIPSGWTKWLLEQFEFPYEIVYPQTLDAGNLNAKFDVLVFPDGSGRFVESGGGRGRGGRAPADRGDHPGRVPRLAGVDHDRQDAAADQEVRAGRRHGGDDRQLDVDG